MIEHDWRLARLIRCNLEASGWEVVQAVDGRHALALLRRRRPDVVLIDLDQFDGDLRSLVGTVHDRSAGRPPRLMVTSSEPPGQGAMEGVGASAYLQKPFAASALLAQVHLALGEP